MQRLPYPTETVLSNKITEHRIVLSFKDSPRKPLGRRPFIYRVVDLKFFPRSNGLYSEVAVDFGKGCAM